MSLNDVIVQKTTMKNAGNFEIRFTVRIARYKPAKLLNIRNEFKRYRICKNTFEKYLESKQFYILPM